METHYVKHTYLINCSHLAESQFSPIRGFSMHNFVPPEQSHSVQSPHMVSTWCIIGQSHSHMTFVGIHGTKLTFSQDRPPFQRPLPLSRFFLAAEAVVSAQKLSPCMYYIIYAGRNEISTQCTLHGGCRQDSQCGRCKNVLNMHENHASKGLMASTASIQCAVKGQSTRPSHLERIFLKL